MSEKVVSMRRQAEIDELGRLGEALAQMGLALALWADGDRTEAIEALESAIAIEQEVLGLGAKALGPAYAQLGGYLLVAGRWDDAGQALETALAILQGTGGAPAVIVATRALCAERLVKTGRDAAARDLFLAVIPQAVEVFGAWSPEVGRLHLGLGVAYEGLGQHEDAVRAFKSALVVGEAIQGAYPVLIRDALGGLVRVEFAIGENEAALTYLDRLLDLLPDEEALG